MANAYVAGNFVETIGRNTAPEALAAASLVETIGRNSNPKATVAASFVETITKYGAATSATAPIVIIMA